MAEVSIVRAVLINDGDILVLQNSPQQNNKDIIGQWELPGGRVEDGEIPETAVEREVEEETGLDCELVRPLATITVAEDGRERGCQYFLLKTDSRKVRLSREHSDHRWIKPDEFKQMDWYKDAGYSIPVVEHLEV